MKQQKRARPGPEVMVGGEEMSRAPFLSSRIESTHHPEQQHDRDGRDERYGRAGDRGLGQVPDGFGRMERESKREGR